MTAWVPAGGLPAWSVPDPNLAPVAHLEAGLDVTVAETAEYGWTRIVCSNGWSGWVDGPKLTMATETAAPSGSYLQRVGGFRGLQGVGSRLVRAPVVPRELAAVGGAVVVLASFLPWFTAAGTSVSGWKVSLHYVLFGTGDGVGGLKLGVVLLLAGVVPVLTLMRATVPAGVVLGLACVGTWTSVFAMSHVVRPQPHPGLGVGAIAALAGGLLIVTDVWLTLSHRRRVRVN